MCTFSLLWQFLIQSDGGHTGAIAFPHQGNFPKYNPCKARRSVTLDLLSGRNPSVGNRLFRAVISDLKLVVFLPKENQTEKGISHLQLFSPQHPIKERRTSYMAATVVLSYHYFLIVKSSVLFCSVLNFRQKERVSFHSHLNQSWWMKHAHWLLSVSYFWI